MSVDCTDKGAYRIHVVLFALFQLHKCTCVLCVYVYVYVCVHVCVCVCVCASSRRLRYMM